MNCIGITGGIGSGKSTIAKELVRRGYRVYDCDREAKRIITENPSVRAAIIDLLGEEAFTPAPSSFVHRTSSLRTSYNTSFVAQKVFAHPELLQRLNAIVHPAVKEDIRQIIHGQCTDAPLFVESAILYEAGLEELCDLIVVVEAPEEVRIARVIARDYHGEATPENIARVRARIHAQKTTLSLTNAKYTDGKLLVLNNDGLNSVDSLVSTVLSVL